MKAVEMADLGIRRCTHVVDPVAILAVCAATAEDGSSTVIGVGVIKTEIVPHLMCDHVRSEGVLPIDPNIGAANGGISPPRAAPGVARHQVDKAIVVGKI